MYPAHLTETPKVSLSCDKANIVQILGWRDCSTTVEIDLEYCSYGNLDSVMEQQKYSLTVPQDPSNANKSFVKSQFIPLGSDREH